MHNKNTIYTVVAFKYTQHIYYLPSSILALSDSALNPANTTLENKIFIGSYMTAQQYAIDTVSKHAALPPPSTTTAKTGE